jgi:Flp pilus assembly protein TadG
MCMHTKRVIGWLRGEPQDRRRAGRYESPGLFAHYYNGEEPVQQAILDVSSGGAFIKSSKRLYPKTVIRLLLHAGEDPAADDEDASGLILHASVTRVTAAGVGVKFLFLNEQQRQDFKNILRGYVTAAGTPAVGVGRGERGQSILEFALCLPLLLLIVTGIMTFGIALNNYLQLTGSVNIGARLLAVSRGQTTDPCALTVTAISQASLLTSASLSYSFVLNGTTYTGSTCSSSSTTTGAAGNLIQGASAKVKATYPCNLSVFGVNYAPSCTMTAQTTEIVQ